MTLLVALKVAAMAPTALSGFSAADVAAVIYAADPKVSGPVPSGLTQSGHCTAEPSKKSRSSIFAAFEHGH